MKAHLVYLRYVIKHKWYVFLMCCKLGVPWLGLVHDWSKFAPIEWFPYVHHFYNPDGSEKQIRNKTGYYKPIDTGDPKFDLAWFHHQKCNKHHWQYWTIPTGEGKVKTLRMPTRYLMEMVADWCGAARAQGLPTESIQDWYAENQNKLLLHPITRLSIEFIIAGNVA